MPCSPMIAMKLWTMNKELTAQDVHTRANKIWKYVADNTLDVDDDSDDLLNDLEVVMFYDVAVHGDIVIKSAWAYLDAIQIKADALIANRLEDSCYQWHMKHGTVPENEYTIEAEVERRECLKQ